MNDYDPLARWTRLLESWAIPDRIVEAAPESPWGFPVGLFEKRAVAALERPLTYSNRRALEAMPAGGSVLDVGAGGGAASLPLAGRAGLITAVDSSEKMLGSFSRAVAAFDVEHRVVAGDWPALAREAPEADVVVCHHVLYNVPDLGPFARALHDHARKRVVVELTPHHPLAWMNDLWERFHNLRRPDGPTYEDAIDCLHALGFKASGHAEAAPSVMSGFETRADALAFVRKRMCLHPIQDEELAEALGDRLTKTRVGWSAAPPQHRTATLWWDVDQTATP